MPDHASTPSPLRRRFVVTGAVQGVGFRPFVHRLAREHALTGSVRNTPEGVAVEVQGPSDAVDAFGHDLLHRLPPLARIVSCVRAELEAVPGETAFAILASTAGQGHNVLISPDTATCADCLADMDDPAGRRHDYPFTNCTNCGPRYTITRSVPYDRATTSMACFPLCPDCAREYADPGDRRFHAQPNACPVCGPRLWLADASGRELASGGEAIAAAARALAGGALLAMKGLGGFHLVCDAADARAVALLRERKHRYGKPLALMVADRQAARALARLDAPALAQLTAPARPIVLAPARRPSPLGPALALLAPDTPELGLMLPYTPLHHVLFKRYAEARARAGASGQPDGPGAPPCPPALVMTSGNLSSEPICTGNREALARLAGVADIFLLHDRDILVRCDDSVLRVVDDGAPDGPGPQFLRRARGFTPAPVFLSRPGPTVLGAGPELKATLCLTKGDQAFVSQHIGTMENLETSGFYQEMAAHLQDVLRVEPRAVAHDLHPDFMTTAFAREYAAARGLPLFPVQHHLAHIHAVMAENRFDGAVIGLALDGTGLGEDGTLWGGECLLVDNQEPCHERLGHFSPVRLPGGEAAIREPWRVAQAFLHALGVAEPRGRPWPWLAAHGPASALVARMLERELNSPLTTSCGRLFDAVGAMLGIKLVAAYEAEAAIALESAQYGPGGQDDESGYDVPLRGAAQPAQLDTLALFAQVLADWEAGVPAGTISRRFHLGLVRGLADMAAAFAAATGLDHVALSGGSMLNRTLATLLPRALRARGLEPLVHRALPPGDGCISLGQAALALRLLEGGPGGTCHGHLSTPV